MVNLIGKEARLTVVVPDMVVPLITALQFTLDWLKLTDAGNVNWIVLNLGIVFCGVIENV